MKIVDAKGQKCPMPLILTKRALLEKQPEETLQIIIDNEISVRNVSRFLDEHGLQVTLEHREGLFYLMVSQTGTVTEETSTSEYCELPGTVANDYLVCFQKNIQGAGSDELGYRLMLLFINTLQDIDHKPGTMVFLNSSVFLVLRDSPVLEQLKLLEKQGIKILVCGTCLDFFQKKEELAVGIVSNMFEILDLMARTPKVLYP